MFSHFRLVFVVLATFLVAHTRACCCWGFDFFTGLLKYDRESGVLTTECPPVDNCKHGIDDDPYLNIAGYSICPQCLRGPGDDCGSWEGDCGNGLVCQYSGIFQGNGRCVDRADFNSRREGQSCGQLNGNCGQGLKCRIDPLSLSGICGIGRCVTVEEFASRDEGETCGPLLGDCRDGLKCKSAWFGFCSFMSICKRVTNRDVIAESHDVVDKSTNATAKVKFDSPDDDDDDGRGTVTAKLDTDVISLDDVNKNNPVTSTSDTASIHLMNGGKFKELKHGDYVVVSDGTK